MRRRDEVRISHVAALRRLVKRETFRAAGLYLSISLVVIVLLIPVYTMTYNAVRNQFNEQLQSEMESNARVFASDMSTLETYISVIMEENSLTYLAHIPDSNGLHVTKAKELFTTTTRSLLLGSTLADDFVVLIPNCEYMLTGNGILRHAGYYGRAVEYEGFGSDASYETALFSERKTNFPVQQVYTQLLRKPRQALTLNYYSNTTAQVYYAISVIVLSETLQEMLMPQQLQDAGYLALSDARGMELVSFGEKTDRLVMFDPIPVSDGKFHIAYGVDSSVYAEPVQVVSLLIVLYCCIALTAAAILSILLARRNTRPLRKVEALLGQLMSEDEDDDFNYDSLNEIVHRSLNRALSRAGMLERDLKKALDHSKNDVVLSLMNGVRPPSEEDIRLLKDESVLFGEYVLAELVIMDEEAATPQMHEAIIQTACELLGEFMPNAYITSKRPFVAVLSQQGNTQAMLSAICAQISSNVAPITMVVSAPNTGPEGLHPAYLQMQTVLKNKHLFIFEKEMVMRFESLPIEQDSEKMIVSVIDSGLVHLLTRGERADLDASLEALKKQFDAIALNKPQRLSAYYYSFIRVYEDLYRVLGETPALQEFNAKLPVAEMEEYLCQVARDLQGRLQAQREQIEPHEKIIAYVNEHFADGQMSLGLLSSEFNLSEAYISRIIKRCTDMNYSAYIEKLRMQKADELLLSTQMSVSDIAEALGYENQSTFFKAFKRYFKVSPGAYRSSCKILGARQGEQGTREGDE